MILVSPGVMSQRVDNGSAPQMRSQGDFRGALDRITIW